MALKTFGKIDLHMHSNYSDGAYSVEEIFRTAKKAKFSLIAITDHDTAEHWDEAMKLSQERQIPCILGTEFSAMYHGIEVHILGYGYDRNHSSIASILKDYKEANMRWVINMAINFAAKTGIVVDFSDFDYKGNPDKVRIAKYFLEKGYITQDENTPFSQVVNSTFKQGGQYYIKRKIKRRKYTEIIRAIHEAGGISVLAHPQKNKLEKEHIQEMVEAGLQGVEVYTRKNLQDSEKYISIAKEFNLLMTGGSDFHGIGEIGIDYEDEILSPFMDKIQNYI